jgi:hypothetical protein
MDAEQAVGLSAWQLDDMAKPNGASAHRPDVTTAAWAERQAAAYRGAEQEIELLRPGEAILYHEGNLAIDIGHDPAIAGRAAAFRDATEAARGRVAQRRLGFEWYQYIFWRSHRD